jgi:SAM-dependent methyltransferase
MPTGIPVIEGERRLKPRLWDYNFYLMTEIRKSLQRAVEAELPRGGNPVVVDYGCGTRPYEPIFQGRVGRYIGVDVGANAQADICLEPGQKVPLPDQSVDLILSVQVLEHVVDVDSYLSECKRLLRPGGVLVLSTHGCWVYHPYPTDVRRWTCWGLKYEVERFGFQVTRQDGCVGPLAYTSQLRLQLVRGFLYRFGRLAAPVTHLMSALTQAWMMAEDWITPTDIRLQNSVVYLISAKRLP